MKSTFEKRLAEIESKYTDWISRLELVDYIGMTDYGDGRWEEVHHDETCTVFRHKETGEIRGVYADRRTDEEKLAAGGKLEFS